MDERVLSYIFTSKKIGRKYENCVEMDVKGGKKKPFLKKKCVWESDEKKKKSKIGGRK